MTAYSIGAERYRLGGSSSADQAAPTTASGLTALPTPSAAAGAEGRLWHPSSPMLAFGVVAALTFGLMAVSTSGSASVRLGKVKATVGAGAGVGS